MISANVISGPFYEPFAEASFQSIQGLVDEIIVVDTAPGNNPNEEVNKKYATSVLNFPGGGTRDFSFSAARELARVNSTHDWVLKWDQDEVLHEKDVETIKNIVEDSYSNGIEFAFYHFMVYPWLYQFIDFKCFLFRKHLGKWGSDVHEGLSVSGGRLTRLHDIRVFHYGYLRGQEEVFKRWKLYAEIVDKPNWYDGQDPSNIITDRIAVCQNFIGEHPLVAQSVLTEMFKDVVPFQIRPIPRYKMSDKYVGLLLITYNDAENLKPMLSSLEQTIDYPTIIHVIDMGSTDDTLYTLTRWERGFLEFPNDEIKAITIEKRDSLEALAVVQNAGFKALMSRQECEYIGWIHPDMFFEEGWLKELVATLIYRPEIGKICSFNTRNGGPNSLDIIAGQEQAYIMRRGLLLNIGLFDEDFIGIGGYEDWDMNNRIRRESLKVAITPLSRVLHKGMGTRERRDTSKEQIHNAGVYYKKWGTYKEWISFE
jgi:GT2 family glycosyltransferase